MHFFGRCDYWLVQKMRKLFRERCYIAEQSPSGIYSATKLVPKMTRFTTITIPDAELEHYTLRMVAINAFYFYLAIPVQPYMVPQENELMRICEFFSLMTLLDPELIVATVKTTGLAVHNIVVPHFIQYEEAYLNQNKSMHGSGRRRRS